MCHFATILPEWNFSDSFWSLRGTSASVNVSLTAAQEQAAGLAEPDPGVGWRLTGFPHLVKSRCFCFVMRLSWKPKVHRGQGVQVGMPHHRHPQPPFPTQEASVAAWEEQTLTPSLPPAGHRQKPPPLMRKKHVFWEMMEVAVGRNHQH